MRQFDVFYCHPPGWNEPHPCVIVSHPDRVARKNPVEVVMCSSKRANRQPEAGEIVLDQADGFDWPTLCKCDLIYAVPVGELKKQKGRVTRGRQAQLVRTIIDSHGWAAAL